MCAGTQEGMEVVVVLDFSEVKAFWNFSLGERYYCCKHQRKPIFGFALFIVSFARTHFPRSSVYWCQSQLSALSYSVLQIITIPVFSLVTYFAGKTACTSISQSVLRSIIHMPSNRLMSYYLLLLGFFSPKMPTNTIKCFEIWIPMKLAVALDL